MEPLCHSHRKYWRLRSYLIAPDRREESVALLSESVRRPRRETLLGNASARSPRGDYRFGVLAEGDLVGARVGALTGYSALEAGWFYPKPRLLDRLGRTLKTAYESRKESICIVLLRLSPRPISTGNLHALLHFQRPPINLVVFKGSYFLMEWDTLS